MPNGDPGCAGVGVMRDAFQLCVFRQGGRCPCCPQVQFIDGFDAHMVHARPALRSTPGGLTPHSARSSNRARQLQLIRAEIPSNGYPQPSGSSKNARQWHFIRAERSSNGSCRSHRALEASSLPSCFCSSFSSSVAPLWPLGLGILGPWQRSESYLFLRRYGRISGQPSSSSLARRACVHYSGCSAFYCMAYLVFVPFKFVYSLFLKFARAPGLSGGRGEMAMAVASSARLALIRGAVCACCTPYTRHFPFFGPCTAMVH